MNSAHGLITDYNKAVQDGCINLLPCAYLHNYRRKEHDPLDEEQYTVYLEDAPAFTRGQVDKLRAFIKKRVVKGDDKSLLYSIENGKIKPSKSLQESIARMLKGSREFVMLDEQKVVYEEILNASRRSMQDHKKRVIIVQGGPGTGKTVVAINLLSQLTNEEQFCQYVSKNSAPRNVYQKKLKGEIRKSSVDNMFKGSGIYTEAEAGSVDTILAAWKKLKNGQKKPEQKSRIWNWCLNFDVTVRTAILHGWITYWISGKPQITVGKILILIFRSWILRMMSGRSFLSEIGSATTGPEF